MEVTSCRVIGYYVTEKKNAKMNWSEFNNICRNHGFALVKINLQESLEKQGPFFAIIHKMTDVIVKSSMGDSEAVTAVNNVESYIKSHPEVIVVDPLDRVRSLLDRSRYYRIVQDSDLGQDQVFMPTFVDLISTDINENLQRLKDAGITYPFVCKPSVSHGSDAHQMAVVFNEKGVADCKPPCVAQSFINHNAVLYKIYSVGHKFSMCERPSLKNFSASDNETIFFTTSDVSKADSTSSLTVLDPEDLTVVPDSKPDSERLRHIVSSLWKELGMMLFGVDVVIEHGSGRYGIIDINIFPSYDGFPNFFSTLMDSILDTASAKSFGSLKKSRRMSDETEDFSSARKYEKIRHPKPTNLEAPLSLPKRGSVSTGVKLESSCFKEYEQDDSGFDTGDSSDERKKKWGMGRGRGQVRAFSAPVQPPRTNSCENSARAGLSGV